MRLDISHKRESIFPACPFSQCLNGHFVNALTCYLRLFLRLFVHTQVRPVVGAIAFPAVQSSICAQCPSGGIFVCRRLVPGALQCALCPRRRTNSHPRSPRRRSLAAVAALRRASPKATSKGVVHDCVLSISHTPSGPVSLADRVGWAPRAGGLGGRALASA